MGYKMSSVLFRTRRPIKCLATPRVRPIIHQLSRSRPLDVMPFTMKKPLNMLIRHPSVQLRQGTYVGAEDSVTYPQPLEHFLGIPYALPTSGSRRFAPPVRISRQSTEVFNAIKHGPNCPSSSMTPSSSSVSEDCLNLNLYRPRRGEGNENAKLPVLVYVHGGSFNFGDANDRDIPSLVAWSSEPIIAVTFNYRIGALGFLPSKLTAELGLLNVGLKDQIALLEWVQENISEFGGDPNNVTIMGLSAGAHSVGHHLSNTKNAGLFHRAILESGACTARNVWKPDHPQHEAQFLEFLSHLNCQDLPRNQIIPHLRTLPASSIQEASETVFGGSVPSVCWPWQPVIDNDVVNAPLASWQTNTWLKMPILTGFNTNEGSGFVPQNMSQSSEFSNFFRTLRPDFSEADLQTLEKVYPDPATDPTSKYARLRHPRLGAQFERVEAAYGQFAYAAPVRQTAHYAAADPEAPVYLYHFDVKGSVIGGVNHGDHSGFVTYSQNIVDSSTALAAVAWSMHAYWTSFIVFGEPNKGEGMVDERPVWPRYEQGTGKLMMFGEGNNELTGGRNPGTAVRVMDDTWMVAERNFWWSRTAGSRLNVKI